MWTDLFVLWQLLHWFWENCFERIEKKWIAKHHFYHTSLLLKRFSIILYFLQVFKTKYPIVKELCLRDSLENPIINYLRSSICQRCVLLTLAVDKHLVGLLKEGVERGSAGLDRDRVMSQFAAGVFSAPGDMLSWKMNKLTVTGGWRGRDALEDWDWHIHTTV